MEKGCFWTGVVIIVAVCIVLGWGYLVQYLYNYAVVDSMQWHNVYMDMKTSLSLGILYWLFAGSNSVKYNKDK